jgi:hypothetical protein
LKKTYLFLLPFLSLLLMLIVSCSGVPKNNEQGTGSEQSVATELVEVSSGQSVVTELVEVTQPEAIPEEPVLAEAVAEEENPTAEYVEAFALDEHREITEEPELQPTEIVMENLRPAETASPVESVLPLTSVPPSEPVPPALPEQRTAQTVPTDFSPPVRESWRQPPAPSASPKDAPEAPKKDTLATTQGPVVNDQPVTSAEAESLANNSSRGSPPEERILQPDYPITFSRVARVTVGQLVEIPFRGRDWVFLGEVGARRGIAYDSRKLEPEGESFIFRVEASGIYALKFYRQDFAHDLVLNDHVQIIAGEAPETTGLGWFNPPTDRSRVVAEPRWPNFLSYADQPLSRPVEELGAQPPVTVQPPATAQPPVATQPPATARPPAAVQPATPPARNETARPQGPSGNALAQASPAQPQSPSVPRETTAPKETPQPVPAAEPVSPDSILKQARDEFNAGRIASAITLLDQFCKSFPSGSDEAWWLYGQCFEANSPNRNMLSALDYYRRLVREYPQSSRLNDARRRISYLERYYINIQ